MTKVGPPDGLDDQRAAERSDAIAQPARPEPDGAADAVVAHLDDEAVVAHQRAACAAPLWRATFVSASATTKYAADSACSTDLAPSPSSASPGRASGRPRRAPRRDRDR